MKNYPVDAVILGDGETIFLKLLESLSQNKTASSAGLYYGNMLSHYNNFNEIAQDNLNNLELPDRTIVDYRKYKSILGKDKYIATMISSRGCPYQCTYCKILKHNVHYLSAERVLADFELIEKLGFSEVDIYDDTFTLNKERIIAILEGIIKSRCLRSQL